MKNTYFDVEYEVNVCQKIYEKEEFGEQTLNDYFGDSVKFQAFLFYHFGAYYPIMNKNRQEKLWGYYERRFGLPVKSCFEEFVDLRRYWMYYGLASINTADISKYLDSFKYCNGAYIIVNNGRSVDIENIAKSVFMLTDREEGIDFRKLITSIIDVDGIVISKIGNYESIFVFSPKPSALVPK